MQSKEDTCPTATVVEASESKQSTTTTLRGLEVAGPQRLSSKG